MQTKLSNFLKWSVHNISGPMYGALICFGLVFLAAADFWTRWLCFARCAASGFVFDVGLHPFVNKFFVFSLPIPLFLMYAIYGAVCVAMGAYLSRRWGGLALGSRIAWLLVFVGAFDNISERLYLGYVRDFIQIGSGYINMADIYILIGITYLFGVGFLAERAGEQDRAKAHD